MSPRTRLVIIIAAGILIIVGIVWIVVTALMRRGGITAEGTVSPKNITPTTTSRVIDSENFSTTTFAAIITPPVDTKPVVTDATPIEIEKKGVEKFARVFAQIYGSFSSDNSYQNVLDVQSLVTAQLWAKIKPPATVKPPAASFVGVTTQVLLTKLVTWNGSSAAVELEALRSETREAKTRTYNQKATVTLVKQGERWLVDSFVWANPQ